MAMTFTITGVKELDDALTYLKDKSAKRIGKAISRKMASTLAKGIRPRVPKSLARSTMMASDKGIGSRGTKSRDSNIETGKAGVAVGRAFRKAVRKAIRAGKRKGVGVSSANLHWFGAGTANRYTGSKGVWAGKGVPRRKVRTKHQRKFVGRINKAIWGGFVRFGAQSMRTTAIADGAQLFKKMVEAEAWASRTGLPPPVVELGTDF